MPKARSPQSWVVLAAICLTAPLSLLACDAEPTEPGGILTPEPITELPRPLAAAETQLVGSSNGFGFSLFQELVRADPGENLFVSPLSAHMALGMALSGARDETLDAMRSALGFAVQDGDDPMPIEDIHAAYTGLLGLLTDLDPAVEIEVANSAWHRTAFPFRTEYLSTLERVFDAEVMGLDFADPSALDAVNGWVNTKTEGRIPKMLDSIDPAEVLLLLNAVYFKGSWTVRFDPELTRDEAFHLSDGNTKTVPMMVRDEGEFLASRHPTFALVDLPYGGAAFRMTIMVPAEGVSLESRLQGLDAATWESWIAGLSPSEVPVLMPRFRHEWEGNLREALEGLGMGVAFQPGQADFGFMLEDGFDPGAAGTDLHISRVKQKSFVEVNEEGTEAAAATTVGIGVTSVPVPFRIDRPFLFAIRERLTGTVLFIGTVYDPT